RTLRSVVEGRAAHARAKREELLDDATEANGRIDEWLTDIARLEKRTGELLDNDDGKAVAGERTLVSRFIAVTDKERPGKDAAEKNARAEVAASAVEEAERAARERGLKKVAEERARAEEATHESEVARVRQEAALKKAEADRELAGKKAAEDKAKRKKELTRR